MIRAGRARVKLNLRGSSRRADYSPDALLTSAEVAAMLNISTEALKDWRLERKNLLRGRVGPRFIRFGRKKGRVRYRRQDVLDWLEQRTIETK